MKKILICVLTFALLLSACGSTAPAGTANGTYVQPVETPPAETTVPPTTPAPTTAVPETTPMASSVPQTAATTPVPETTTEEETTVPEETSHEPSVIASGYAPGEEIPTESPEFNLGVLEEDDMLLTYKGMKLKAGSTFNYKDYEEAWGTPQIEKGAACIGGGFDMNYYYGDGFSVYTVGEGEDQIVYDIYLTEPGYSTVKGAVIGQTTREELAAIYGEPNASLGATDRYTLGDDGIFLSFTFTGGVLTDIDYNDSNQS